MKQFFSTTVSALLLLAVGFDISAQSPVPAPSAYPSTVRKSYIRTYSAQVPEQDPELIINRLYQDIRQNAKYFDGLGRPFQEIEKQGSMITGQQPVDKVAVNLYDRFGRNTYNYLPFAANNASSNSSIYDGGFKFNPFQQQSAFYSSPNKVQNPIAGQGELFFYGETIYEQSPDGRETETRQPGNSWAGSSVGRRIVWGSNTLKDSVVAWSVDSSMNIFGVYASLGIYQPGTLYKKVITDEDGKQIIEFVDKNGLLILKKVQLESPPDEGPGRGYNGWISTYHIYDDLSRLRCIIQPKGVILIAGTWSLTPAILNEQCYQYAYDDRNRLIAKKIPGAEEILFVYDRRDRLTMVQDGKTRYSQGSDTWMVTVYDELNRVIQTGFWRSSNNHTFHMAQSRASNSYYYPFDEQNIVLNEWDMLSRDHYDDYDGLAPGLTADFDQIDNQYLSASGNTWPYAVMPQKGGNVLNKNTWSQRRVIKSGAPQFLTEIILYDEDGRIIQTKQQNITGGIDIVTNQYCWNGMPHVNISSSTNNIGEAQRITIVTKKNYDKEWRLDAIEKEAVLKNLVSNATTSASKFTLVRYEYDALGQIKEKQLRPQMDQNGTYIGQQLESLKYDYNILGWMLGLNRSYVATEGQSSEGRFGFEIGYDKTSSITGRNFVTPALNGNLSGVIWKSDGDDIRRKYDFIYDRANRLLRGDFSQQNPEDLLWNNAKVDYSVKLGNGIDARTAYDDNGNILQMQQWGLTFSGSKQIDNLKYYYQNTNVSNKLQAVVDSLGDLPDALGDFRTSDLHPQKSTKSFGNISSIVDYSYDANGNPTRDYNKDIGDVAHDGIRYNYLNYPDTIEVRKDGGQLKGIITYLYDASGSKWQKKTVEYGREVRYNDTTYISDVTTISTYLNGAVFETKIYSQQILDTILGLSNRLQLVEHEEGRFRFIPENDLDPVGYPAKFVADYLIKDHIGNVRMVLTDEARNDIYPIATLENAKSSIENLFYAIDDTKIVSAASLTQPPPAYANDNGIGNNPSDATFEASSSEKLYKLNSNSNKIGLGLTLKVTAGDTINIFGKSYWYSNNTGGNNANLAPVALDILSGLLTTPTGTKIGIHALASDLNAIPEISSPIGNFINNQDRDNSSYPLRPKAAINYLLLDNEFKYVTGNFSMVNSTPGLKSHFSELQNIPVDKTGYLYLYVSNESPVDVYFDNLQVTHTSGPILEETHYYPFGLTMKAISSTAVGANLVANKRKFNDGTELNTDLNISLYETDFRSYDPQIGRFLQIDLLADITSELSPFAYGNNNPLLINDPSGLLGDTLKPVTVTSYVIKQRPMQMINTPGRAIIKNPNYSPLSDDKYLRQPYLDYQTWKPSDARANKTVGDAVLDLVDLATWVVPSTKLFAAAKWLLALRKVKLVIGIARFVYASKYGIKSYKVLKALNKSPGTEVHHLIEKRFAHLFDTHPDDMVAIVLTKEEHRYFTNEWLKEIVRMNMKGSPNTFTATRAEVEDAARRIYANFPEILKAIGL